jgi:hypothetical protein
MLARIDPESATLTMSPIMTEREAADYLKVGHSSLMRWRREGIGPKFIRLSPRRIAYRLTDLHEFLRDCEHTVERSA